MRHRMGAFFKTPRTIRMAHDLQDMKAYKNDSTILDFEAFGDPPERYMITFHGKSLVPLKGESGVKLGDVQKVELILGVDYPRNRPDIRWRSPIMHPNISGGGVCLGNYSSMWTPYFKLVDLVEILWDYTRMAVLNAEGGYNRGSLDWDSLRRHFQFPVDRRPLRDKVLDNNSGSSIVRPGGDEFDIVIMPDDEGTCST